MAIVEAVEEGALLLAVAGILEGIEVEDDAPGSVATAGEEQLQQLLTDAGEVVLSDGILEAREGGLTGERSIAWGFAESEFEEGVVTQSVGVILVVVALNDEVEAFAEEIEKGVLDARGVTGVGANGGEPGSKSETLIGQGDGEEAGVGRKIAAVEGNLDAFFGKKREIHGRLRMIHGERVLRLLVCYHIVRQDTLVFILFELPNFVQTLCTPHRHDVHNAG